MIQSYDFIRGAEGAGSMARIRAACTLYEAGEIPADSIVLWPQGYQKRHPSHPAKPGQESLGENLAHFCKTQPEMAQAEVVAVPISWTTKGDILAAYGLVRDMGYEKVCFHFVSDKTHLRRVKLVWWMTHPRGWAAEFYAAPGHTMTRRERFIREPVACVAYFFQLLPMFLRRLKS